MQQDLIHQISRRTGLPTWKVKNTVDLLNDGATIPFISRYRKEAIGSLDEVSVSDISKELKRIQEIQVRKQTILATIDEQGKLTPELRANIESCWDTTELEDIYLPFKPKRQTRATKARDAGLEPMAKIIMKQHEAQPHARAHRFICTAYPDADSVISGAQDIMAEWISESTAGRNVLRRLFASKAEIVSKVVKSKETEGQKYRDYFKFRELLRKCPSHRLLAIRRGESEGVLRVSIQPDREEAISKLQRIFVKSSNSSGQLVSQAVEDAYKRLLSSSIETEFRNSSKAKADEEAIGVFAKNLRQLLLAPPLGKKAVLAIDPGFRSGCKVVCLDKQGQYLGNATIYPHPPQSDKASAERAVLSLIDKFNIEVIAIGNGTAGRETEAWLKSIVHDSLEMYLVNEDGASIYSAGEVARNEFPDLDLTVRGAISIGRRLLDPLAELVKIDPKSIGVGQYQHDVDQKLLKQNLDEVVTSCVNAVGINLNTASAELLGYVSGIGSTTASNIIEHRNQNGPFESRKDIKKVKGIGDKAFEQCAGFLRISGATNPLDNSAVHPERYGLVAQIARDADVEVEALIGNTELIRSVELQSYVSDEVGMPTLTDIADELLKPGLDPRGEIVAFEFADIHSIDDIYEGMVVPGKVTNITKFGAFVDIGIKENGLVHISEMADRYISDPSEVVGLDQSVMARISSIDRERGRIGLSLKDVST